MNILVSTIQFEAVPMSKRKVVRSAITGQFVPEVEAKRHPKTTVTETIKYPKKEKSDMRSAERRFI